MASDDSRAWPGKYESSVKTVELKSWDQFDDWVREVMLDYRHYIWRGHASEKWLLEPTLDRMLRKVHKLKSKKARIEHLERFKYAARGRRGVHPPNLIDDDDWWALGQHNGLATPLLDWSRSPFVAAYFAFYPEDSEGAENRAIFALSKYGVSKRCKEIKDEWSGAGDPPMIKFFEPLTDENPRLVSQGGAFTRGPDGVHLEAWIREHFASVKDRKVRLYKVLLPDSEREIALRSLNRMNINHLSLFPDLYGASRFVNLDLMIKRY